QDLCGQTTGPWTDGNSATTELSLDPAEISAERAIPLLLAMAELLSNAFQHAYPPGGAGVVRIASKAAAAEEWAITVSDEGRGICGPPPAGAVGITLARELARQIDGSLELDERHGVTWTLTFPLASNQIRW
ncbi:MAG: ATP-binding protein, partial [bacterium]